MLTLAIFGMTFFETCIIATIAGVIWGALAAAKDRQQ